MSLAWAPPNEDEDEGWRSDPRDVDHHLRAVFGKDRVVALEVPDPGRYRVELTFWEMEMDGGTGSSIATVPMNGICMWVCGSMPPGMT